MSLPINFVSAVYYGSNAANTRRLGTQLKSCGPMGELASLLFTAQKASSRAKCYRGIEPACGRSFRDLSYERKQEALCQLAHLLDKHGTSLGIRWGWGKDDNPKMPDWVLYIDLPQGQVSFHSLIRFLGTNYEDNWDGHDFSESRILEFCASALAVGGQGLDAA